MNEKYQTVSNACLKKKYANILPASFQTINLPKDSDSFIKHKLFNKSKSASIDIVVPNKNTLAERGINCNFALFVTDLFIYKTTCSGLELYAPFAMPAMPWKSNKPSFGIKGKYILWDYDKNSAICAGDFDNNLDTLDIWNKGTILKSSYSFIARILDKTKYWEIGNVYEEE